MTKIVITNPDGGETVADIDMEKLWTLAQTFISGTKIEIPSGYFNNTGATIVID